MMIKKRIKQQKRGTNTLLRFFCLV
jgi:hypothetical protein